jgi:AcrR family transcriptional regulator
MSDNAPSDRRTRKTTAALWEALLALLQDHDWDAITVQMIAERADVARSTFYAHYPTKQDLLDAGFSCTAIDLCGDILARPSAPGRLATLDWLLTHLVDSRGISRRLRGSAAGLLIQARFRQTVGDLLAQELTRDGIAPDPRRITFLTGGVFAVAETWAARGGPESPEALAGALAAMVLDHAVA